MANAIETAQDFQQQVVDLRKNVWSFAVLASALEAGLLDGVTQPRTIEEIADHSGVDVKLAERMLEVLRALGFVNVEGDHYAAATGVREVLASARRDVFTAVLRSEYLQAREMIERAKRGDLRSGWDFHDAEILQAQGETGAVVREAARQLFPNLGDLEARLNAEQASLLDVGTGVGVISIELCRMYGRLHAVGIDPFHAAHKEARKNISDAGLTDRITLRDQGVEDLRDDEEFDLAFFPQVFMPEGIVAKGFSNIRRALRPGGWCIAIAFDDPSAALDAALYRLRNVLWGGDPLSPQTVAERMREAGFGPVQMAPEAVRMFRPVFGMRPHT